MLFRKAVRSRRSTLAAGVLAGVLALPVAARANLPAWLQHIVGASTVEAALYRTMQLPAVEAFYPRPPREAQGELSQLIGTGRPGANPGDAELYQLRARADEQALDEGDAEADWKLYAAHAHDPVGARLELADFYQRRLQIPQEIAALREVAAAPPDAAEMYTDPASQRSWRAFERILGAIDQQGLPPSETAATFSAFLARYPGEPAVYAAALQFQLGQRDWPAAQALIARFTHQFPQDRIFPIRAQALLQFDRGNVDAALAVYDHAFEPLWPAELIQSYFALLERSHRQRAFVAAAREQLAAHPDGSEALNALARIFYYEQQSGRLDAARQTLDSFRVARDARNGANDSGWTPNDLFTLAALSRSIHAYAEAARYDYALASVNGTTDQTAEATASGSTVNGGEPAPEAGLAGLISILLEAPAQPLALDAQNLTLYRDIATLDQGPGYWNGILSLWLNGVRPAAEYQGETTRATSYFHRSKAAELLADLDRRFPAAPERAGLHAALIRALAQYGEPAVVVSAGKEYLSAFPAAPEREEVAGLLADAYARESDTADEFALYEAELAELAAKTAGLPLTSSAHAPTPPEPGTVSIEVHVPDPDSADSDVVAGQRLPSAPLAELPTRHSLAAGTAYAAVLDRYLGRLTAAGELPRALTVLRTQLDRNPGDPLLYERLATFLEQNNLSGEEEQVYQQAIAKFQQPGLYEKLARLYLREHKREAFAALTEQVTGIFAGTDIESFFANVHPGQPVGPQLALELNLYAARRFPHDLVFTRNLLRAYQARPTRDPAAYEALLRRQWWAADDLRDEFLSYLSRTGKLQSELSQLAAINAGSAAQVASNPAARREQAEIDIFTSHFEQAAPLLGSVADLYPADADIGDPAISLYRSLAYLDPEATSTRRAVALEKNLLSAAPDSPGRLATLGDLYAEATATAGEDLASAAPFWRRIPELHPGSTQGYLTAATIFWDYFQFDDALAELSAARTRFGSPALFGYEAGAIEENRRDPSAAISEYTGAVIHPIAIHFDSAPGTIQAWLKPSSDAGDSNFHSTAQSSPGSEESKARLIRLSTRPPTRADVDAATTEAVTDHPSNTAALTLRADVLAAQHQGSELTPPLTTLFNQALDHASTLDEAAAVGNLAQGRSLTAVYERALAKQAALTPDPVQKIELEYLLARSLESHDDIAGAARIIDAVHSANPRIAGVVRTSTDFYVRNKQPAKAIATLLEAAKVATPSFARDFTLEAASRANDADDPAQARTLALGLLAQTPYDARVLDIIATSYARAHDDAGLKQFYLARLDAVRQAPGLDSGARRQDIAGLRRGLIPALTRLNDAGGAVDQYIALLSAFPEDTALGQEATLYALQHSREPQLLDFLRTTVKQSSRDSRFMILLAQAEATLGDLPAAEAAYSLAINIRKDRVDLYTARAEIELRLSQTDPAEAERAAEDFERLYLLSYHDPSWMVRLAELRTRQQRPADAVRALETAYITGHARAASDFFTVAAQLERWNLLEEARSFAEQGVAEAGGELLTPAPAYSYSQPESGAAIFARVLARSGHAADALSTLIAARHAAEVSAGSSSVLEAAMAREKITGDAAQEFRANYARQRTMAADQSFRAAINALGQAIQTYNTPEEKQVFGLALDKLHDAHHDANPDASHDAHTDAGRDADSELALQAATAAGLADREAEWRHQVLRTGTFDDVSSGATVDPYVLLQRRRLEFSDLAHHLEAFAARLRPEGRNPILAQAAEAYRDAGDTAGELRLERALVNGNPQLRERFFGLLLRGDPASLTALAASPDKGLADAVVNYTVAHGNQAEALAAVNSRGQSLDPVWRPASASLVETYFANSATDTSGPTHFSSSLAADLRIGDRLSAPPDPTRQLTGDAFFYYASRFGIFLVTVPRTGSLLPDAEDFLPGELEGSPSSPAPYLDLARTYFEAHHMDAATAEYQHALELSPANAAIEDELATSLYRADRRDVALTHWQRSLAILSEMQQHAQYPESWFTSLEAVTRHLGQYHLTATLRPGIEMILGPYLKSNGSYRSNELLRAIYVASATPVEGAHLVLETVRAVPDPDQALRILDDLRRESWLDDQAGELILLRQIELAGKRPSGGANAYKTQLIELYLAQDQVSKAQDIYDSLPATDKGADYKIILAVRTHHLEALLDGWRAHPEAAPGESFGTALYRLMTATYAYKPDPAAIRPLEEFVFNYKHQKNSLVPTDFLALAQLRLDTGDLRGALDLLQKLTFLPSSSGEPPPSGEPPSSSGPGVTTLPVPGGTEYGTGLPDRVQVGHDDGPSPYANTDSAASLLEQNHHGGEAIPFLQTLVRLVPWDASYRLRLAQAELNDNAREQARADLLVVARDAAASYDLRVDAARALDPLAGQPLDLGSKELAVLASPATARTITAARQPYFAAARVSAAAAPGLPVAGRESLLREAIAVSPGGPDADRARLDLLLLQPATANPSVTLAILGSLQNPQGGYAIASYPDENTGGPGSQPLPAIDAPRRGAAIDSPLKVVVPGVALPPAAARLALPARIRLAAQIGSVYERDDDLESALAYAELALSLAQGTPHADLTRRRDELQMAVRLARRNALRRPTLHADLAQAVQVRPQLTTLTLLQEASQ